MGMFDSVYARCPKCASVLEYQSKAGECNLDKFALDEVPVAIAIALDGESKTCNCGEVVELKFPKTSPKWVSMVARIPLPDSDY